MSNEPAALSMTVRDPGRRGWLVGCALTLAATAARGQSAAASAPPAAAAPRLRFRSRRAVCDCAGELDEDAIDRAQSERSAARGGAAASATTPSAGTKPAAPNQNPTPTPRRPAP